MWVYFLLLKEIKSLILWQGFLSCVALSEPGAPRMFSECWPGYRTGFGWGPGWVPFLPTCLGAAACDFRQVTFPLPSWMFVVCKLWVIPAQWIKGAKNVCVGMQRPARKGQVVMLRLVMTSAVTGAQTSASSASQSAEDMSVTRTVSF